MKRELKQKLIILLVAIAVIVTGVTIVPDTAYAEKKIQLTEAEYVCKSGKYVFFIVPFGTSGRGHDEIYRYDTSTDKVKKIAEGMSVSGLNVTSKYIFTAIYEENATYIYRFDKAGRHPKKLVQGYSPIIAGSYIYYINYDKEICRMKLDGTGKKKIKKMQKTDEIWRLYKKEKDVYYIFQGENDPEPKIGDLKGNTYKTDQTIMTNHINVYEDVTSLFSKDGYAYICDNDKLIIYKKNIKSGKKSTIAKFKGKIQDVYIEDDCLIVKAKGTDKDTIQLYFIGISDKEKKEIYSWKGMY